MALRKDDHRLSLIFHRIVDRICPRLRTLQAGGMICGNSGIHISTSAHRSHRSVHLQASKADF